MVARNRYDTSLHQSGTSEFQILKRKGMKHVGSNRSLNLERSKASRYGGLYSRNQSQQKLREYYHDKFVNQLKRSRELKKELREARKRAQPIPNRKRNLFPRNKTFKLNKNILANHKTRIERTNFNNKRNEAKEMRRFDAQLQSACKELKIRMSKLNLNLKQDKSNFIRNEADVRDLKRLLNQVKETCISVKMDANSTEQIVNNHVPRVIMSRRARDKQCLQCNIHLHCHTRNTCKARDERNRIYGNNIFHNYHKAKKEHSFTVTELANKLSEKSADQEISSPIEQTLNRSEPIRNTLREMNAKSREYLKEKEQEIQQSDADSSASGANNPFEEYISFVPTDVPLNSEGTLINFVDFKHVCRHLTQFLEDAAKQIKPASIAHFDMTHSEELHKYIKRIID
jgi:hypothetical protein